MASWINLLDVIYPVGSCYFSISSISPASIIGGTWSAMTGGMLGLTGSTGVATAGSNGGSRTISVNQMPKHRHNLTYSNDPNEETGLSFDSQDYPSRYFLSETSIQRYTSTAIDMPVAAKNLVVLPSGGGQDYIPAHTAVYAWRRTA